MDQFLCLGRANQLVKLQDIDLSGLCNLLQNIHQTIRHTKKGGMRTRQPVSILRSSHLGSKEFLERGQQSTILFTSDISTGNIALGLISSLAEENSTRSVQTQFGPLLLLFQGNIVPSDSAEPVCIRRDYSAI